MIKLSKEKVLLLHQLIAEETGGSVGIRDVGLLESAINNAYATFGGEELYKTKEEKAASLGFSLISNHAFVDGNKRIGVHLTLLFLKLNNENIEYSQAELIDFGLNIASGKMNKDDIKAWFLTHRK